MPNTYSQIYLHCVFAPKYRQALIKPEFEDKLHKYMIGIAKNLNQNIVAINSMPDHCHLLVRIRPTMAPSDFLQKIKGNSSKWINKQGFLQHKFNWQVGSGIFSANYKGIPTLISYIAHQKEHHRKEGFKTEYVNLLKQHGIDYNDEYLLDFLLEE